MTIVLLGASATGKDLIQNILIKNHGYNKILKYTTRNPRYGEKNGKDYWFVDEDSFIDMIRNCSFAEYEIYPPDGENPQTRYYGTVKSDYTNGNNITVLTPHSLRKIRTLLPNNNIISVYIESNLGTRIRRYISRVGVDKFSYNDKNEMCSRIDRDFGMFIGIEDEVDLVIKNNEGANFYELANEISEWVEKRKRK